MKAWTLALGVAALLLAAPPAMADEVDYFNYVAHGGTWADAEKTIADTDDDLMCWAATCSNVLEWTGWGLVGGMTTTDEIFDYYNYYSMDTGGSAYWQWFFDGTTQFAQSNSGGGNFWPTHTFSDYFNVEADDADVMSAIDDYLHAERGIYLSVSIGHAITCWGYQYDDVTGDYLGVWVTDSDDDKYNSPTYPDSLRYYEVTSSGGRWYMQDYYGVDTTYIRTVFGLDRMAVPEPGTLALLGLGLVSVAAARRRRRRK